MSNDLGILQECALEILTCNLCESKSIFQGPQVPILDQFLELLQINLVPEYLSLIWVVLLLLFNESFISLKLTPLFS